MPSTTCAARPHFLAAAAGSGSLASSTPPYRSAGLRALWQRQRLAGRARRQALAVLPPSTRQGRDAAPHRAETGQGTWAVHFHFSVSIKRLEIFQELFQGKEKKYNNYCETRGRRAQERLSIRGSKGGPSITIQACRSTPISEELPRGTKAKV